MWFAHRFAARGRDEGYLALLSSRLHMIIMEITSHIYGKRAAVKGLNLWLSRALLT